MNRDNASSFDALNQRLYQVVSLANTMGSGINRLNTRIENAVTSGVPVTSPANDSAGRNAGGAVPQPDVLIGQARSAILGGAFMVARRSLNQLLVTYPQAPEVPDAYYWLAQSFEQDHPDSARVYYARVFTTYPKAEHAPSALYKLGNLELKSGNVAAARRFWNQIVKDYPKSLEFDSARESLRVNP